jgi:hypothetical protein
MFGYWMRKEIISCLKNSYFFCFVCFIRIVYYVMMSWDSSGWIVWVCFLAGARDFSLVQNVQMALGRVFFPGERGEGEVNSWGMKLTTHPI